jgi:hypothetical protein
MAEVERTRAMRWRRVAPADLEAAERAGLRADALDGGRAAGLGEVAALGDADHSDVVELVLKDVPDGGIVWFDGAVRNTNAALAIATRPGPHLVVVSLEGSPVWARWIELSAGRSTVAVAVTAPGIVACSAKDLARARFLGDSVVATRVRCDEWIAAWPAGDGTGGNRQSSVHVVRCGRGECGPSVEWSASPAWSWAPPEVRTTKSASWPVWATWALVGAGAAVIAGGVVLASGALQSPGGARYVSGGIRSE